MRNSIIRAYALGIITGSFLTAGIVFAAAPAKADGRLDAEEIDYVLTYEDVICSVIDKYHSTNGVMGLTQAIMNDGFTADSAVDIVNAAVEDACPRNWPLLVAIGKAARAQNGSTT